MSVPHKDWQWFGRAGHFICGEYCRFHLCTKVGPWLVSTIGDLVHPRNSGSSEMTERKWRMENPDGEPIGYGRFYETMVFRISGLCGCGCGQPAIIPKELDFRGYNNTAEATNGHLEICEKWAATPPDGGQQ